MLILLRHGRTTWNVEGRFQGWADIPLDEEGRAQARRAAADVAGLLSADRATGGGTGRPDRPAVVLTSDLRRARDTAAPVAAALGAPLIVDAALREVDVGDWESLTRAEAEARHPGTFRRWAAGEDVRRGDGETRAEAGARVARRIETARAYAGVGPAVVVVGHGMALQAAMAVLRDRGAINFAAAPPHLGNGCYLVVDDAPDRRPDARPVG